MVFFNVPYMFCFTWFVLSSPIYTSVAQKLSCQFNKLKSNLRIRSGRLNTSQQNTIDIDQKKTFLFISAELVNLCKMCVFLITYFYFLKPGSLCLLWLCAQQGRTNGGWSEIWGHWCENMLQEFWWLEMLVRKIESDSFVCIFGSMATHYFHFLINTEGTKCPLSNNSQSCTI